MKKLGLVLLATAALYLALAADGGPARAAEPEEASPSAPAMMSSEAMSAMVEDYCLMCHSDAAKTGGLSPRHWPAVSLPLTPTSWSTRRI